MLTHIRTGSAVALVTALLIQAPAAVAQDAAGINDWRSVSVLKPGDQVVVRTMKRTVAGPVNEVTAESISLTTNKRVETFSRQEVRVIYRWSPASIKIGRAMLMGVLGCVALQLAVSLKRSGTLAKSRPVEAAPGIAAAGLAGGLILVAKTKAKKIYQAQ